MGNKMNTVFLLSGGAGRIISAIPSIEKYARLNPNDDFKVIIHGWEALLWNHPTLQDRTYGIGQKGIFDLIVKNNRIVSPEPYHRHSYYNQQSSLMEAFDEEINNTIDHSDLDKPNLYLHSNEVRTIRSMIAEAKQKSGKKKVLVFQPYGSGATLNDNTFLDASSRSFEPHAYLKLAERLSRDFVIIFFGPSNLIHPNDKYSINVPTDDLRFYMAAISECDYFIGCDSVGQHMARAFNKPGTVVLGSTFAENVSYPKHFTFYRDKNIKIAYNPIRIGGLDCEFADRLNDGAMSFNDKQLEEIYNTIIK